MKTDFHGEFLMHCCFILQSSEVDPIRLFLRSPFLARLLAEASLPAEMLNGAAEEKGLQQVRILPEVVE